MANDLITANATAMWQTSAIDQTTVPVVPSKQGALLVLTSSHKTAGVTLSAVSGGGCPASGSGLPGAWQRIAGPFSNASGFDVEMWMGRVDTPGSSTVTITITASTASTTRLNCKEFNTTAGPGTVWTQDGAGGTKQNTASTNVTFPTLTPSGPNRLYVGFGTNGTGLTTGATAGYTVELDVGTNPTIYNPSVANSAQSPISTQSGSAVSYTVGALIKADNPVRQPVLPRARIIRASHW